jgi:hypothetical protein
MVIVMRQQIAFGRQTARPRFAVDLDQHDFAAASRPRPTR